MQCNSPQPDPGTIPHVDSWSEREQNSTICNPILILTVDLHSIQLCIDRKPEKHDLRYFSCYIKAPKLCWRAAVLLAGKQTNTLWMKLVHAGKGFNSLLLLYRISLTSSCSLPPPQKNLAHFCYVPFLVVCICTALYIWFFLPETKGKSFLEISEEFRKRNFRAQSREAFYKGPEEIRSTTL